MELVDAPVDSKSVGKPHEVKLELIVVNTEQPRHHFSHPELEDLMNSIREHGILQPLVVSKVDDDRYELVAGERRYRAAKMLGLGTVPVVLRDTKDDQDKLILALIENIQREDLSPLEEARAYSRMSDEFGMTIEAIARNVGKALSTVSNTIRLLDLPQEIQDAITSGSLAPGSARAILALPDQEKQLAFFRKIAGRKISTRDIEKEVRSAGGRQRMDAVLSATEEELRNALGTKVEIKKKGKSGSIVIHFYSDEEMGELIRKIGNQ